MKIMCLNGWGGTLGEVLLPYLAETAPDVLCLQEIVHSPGTEKSTLVYRDSERVLDQRARLLDEVCAALPDHMPTFCPTARGVLWDGDRAVASYWGIATFVHRSLPVIGQAQGFVHKHYGTDGYGPHPRSRTGHAIRVYDHTAGRPLAIAQMHGLRDPRGKMDTPERAAQADRFLALAHQVVHPGDLTVLCGDFNVEPQSATLRLLEDAGYTDLVTAGGCDGTRTSHYTKPGRFADYMLINQVETVQRFDVVRDPEVSDHCPLVLEI